MPNVKTTVMRSESSPDGVCYAGQTQSGLRFQRPTEVQHKEELDRHIAEWTKALTNRQVMHTLQEAGVPAGIVSSGEDSFFDPQLRSRPHAIVSVDHPGFGHI